MDGVGSRPSCWPLPPETPTAPITWLPTISEHRDQSAWRR
jgi:hypothetical protein